MKKSVVEIDVLEVDGKVFVNLAQLMQLLAKGIFSDVPPPPPPPRP